MSRATQTRFMESAERAVKRLGWNPRWDLEFFVPGEPRPYGYRSGTIRLSLDPGLRDRLERTRAEYDAPPSWWGEDDQALERAFDDVVRSRVIMQFGSYKVCPFSSYDYADILVAAGEGLRSIGAGEAQVKDLTVPLASFFIALVIASVYALEPPAPRFLQGWMLDQVSTFWPGEQPMPSYTAIYIELLLRLCCDDPDFAAAVRQRFPTPLDTLPFEADRGLAILLDSYDYVGTEGDNLLGDDPALGDRLVEELKYSWRRWPNKCFQLVELLAPYVLGDPNPGGGHPELFMPIPGQSPSEQAEQRRRAAQLAGAWDPRALFDQDGFAGVDLFGAPFNPFADRMSQDRWFRQEVLRQSIGRAQTPLPALMGYDALDVIYQERAVKLTIEAETTTRKSSGLDVAHLSRQLSEGIPSLTRVDWSATRTDAFGELELWERRFPITDSSPATSEMAGFPDLMLVTDSSGSMKWDAAGGVGAYDCLLRSVYSVFKFLESKRKAHHMWYSAVNFSGLTLKTRWSSYSDLHVVKKLLFRHQAGGTVLDSTAIEGLIETRKGRFMCLMVSDGRMNGTDRVLATIQRLCGLGNGFVLIQIGTPTPLSKALDSQGYATHVIHDAKQLEGICLDYTRKTWS